MLTFAAVTAAVLWLGLLATPWQPWGTRERLEASAAGSADSGPPPADDDPGIGVTAVVPARNEADHIAGTLAGLRAQSPSMRIIVVDDQSTDDTASRVRDADPGAELVSGTALPAGWTGKLWALAQGSEHATSPLLLLVDADIRLQRGVLAALRARQREHDAGLVSVMASLAMATFWEALLLPAFIYFFKLIYPFSLANGRGRRFAAAAGGCMLVRRDALLEVGGFASLRDAVIDDCTLARHIKRAGYRTWIGLSQAVQSTRRYPRLTDTWAMVSRTAYTQLNYSVLALVACTGMMVLSLIVPVGALAAADTVAARSAGAIALTAMAVSYLPVIRFYGLPWPLAFTLPVVGALFLAMTWTSAWTSWRGVRARWKDREYGSAV